VLDFPDCLAEGKVWDGLDVQMYDWNLVDAREFLESRSLVRHNTQAEGMWHS
jgi:hypothetical protein